MMPGSGRCAACKYLRRRCPTDCIFSPYFPANDPQRFACLHKIYGASNVAKMLQQLPAHLRAEAAESLSFEAEQRVQDPVYGCVGIIYRLQQQIRNAETQLADAQAQLSVSMYSHAQKAKVELNIQPVGSSFNTIVLPKQGNGHFGP